MTMYVSEMVNIEAGVSIGGSGGMQWSVTSSSIVVFSGDGYIVNTSSGEITLTLPGSPVEGDQIGVADYNNNFETNNCVINRNGKNIMGLGENFICDVNNSSMVFVYTDNTIGWKILYGI
jgi:hypothetical protein